MQGYPKHLNSKADYLYVKDNFPKEQWEKDFQKLLDSRKDWVTTGTVASVEAGVTDATHRVIPEYEENGTEPTSYAQQELQDIPTAKIFRLGFTVEEVEGYIASTQEV